MCSDLFRSRQLKMLWGAGTMLCLCTMARAASITVEWDPPTNNVDGSLLTDLAGYKLYYGVASRTYSTTRNVGIATSCTVSNLAEGHTYFLASTACNTAGTESDFSAELQWSVPDMTPPVIVAPAPVTIAASIEGPASTPNFLQGLVVTDNCSSAAQIVCTQSPTAGTPLSVGPMTVTITARDSAGNAATVQVAVTVRPSARPQSPRNLRVR